MKKIIFIPFLFIIALNLFAPGLEYPYSISKEIIIQSEEIRIRELQFEQFCLDYRVNNLKKVYDRASSLPEYMAQNGLTFCNVMVKDTIDNRLHPLWQGYGFLIDDLPVDIQSVFPTSFNVLSYSIKTDWKKADRAYRLGKIERLNPEEAQREANKGFVVWVISERWNHEALVYPDQNKYDKELGPLIVQAGGKGCNGKMYITDKRAFGWRYTKYQDSIRFYKFNWRK
jgi:hypothetical protein